jgi:hypothetical protein
LTKEYENSIIVIQIIICIYNRKVTMDIKVFKLITMEEVLSEVESEDDTHYVLVNPVGIAVVRGQDGKPNVGLAPFPLHGEQKTGATIAIPKRSVVYSYVPAEDFVNNYNQIFGSGIVLPPTKSLITG